MKASPTVRNPWGSISCTSVHSYVTGLSGEIEANIDNGTCYTITFSEYEECQATDL